MHLQIEMELVIIGLRPNPVFGIFVQYAEFRIGGTQSRI